MGLKMFNGLILVIAVSMVVTNGAYAQNAGAGAPVGGAGFGTSFFVISGFGGGSVAGAGAPPGGSSGVNSGPGGSGGGDGSNQQ
ncbi:Hypothetical protein NTJ_15994 [Nesidiocoris tenuis]|uniref:DUF4766 domain-containing protein n=1 Tax=Nesidiocoris tenuis TaxID=355587 RepID=A0ABN7BFM9_9HEMI|nr:Hypothetical protein NTJ_15994 [Nesidiocoris tenuis]